MKIGVIGTGNMGGALMDAFCRGPHTLRAYNPGREKLAAVCARTGAEPADTARSVLEGAELILLAVKPAVMPDVLREIAPAVTPEQLIVTIAAGIPLSVYTEALGGDKKIIRAMPNTPAAVQAGMTALCYGDRVTPGDRAEVEALFALAGETAVLPERLMGAVTALTGSSPAYVYMFIEAMADGGCLAGFPRDLAYKLSAQAVLGAAKMVLETGKHPAQLKDEVCSPGGTTIRAVAALEQGGMRSAVLEAVRACAEAAG